jgi:REP element-mobilizing transposase RayT
MDEKFSERKRMRLKGYSYSLSGAYFVTIRIQDTAFPLSNILCPVGDGALDVPKSTDFIPFSTDDPTVFDIKLSPVGKIIEKHLLASEKIEGVKIDRYIIMPDHIHAIIFLNSEKYANSLNGTSRAPSPTNQMLPHIISTFKRFCNQEIGRNIFQRGYMEHIIRDPDDYETRVNYICKNPIRWYYMQIRKEQE